ncbi:hypothetical protein GCM10023189_14140 [Nibrella saemangeumensis]|uniref:HTH araC/xylS-type domain-containing protein n=1 Tax=Nibrella saemangeumensis TaxID=1084526 RepID=A0ABP8MM99_9BACT
MIGADRAFLDKLTHYIEVSLEDPSLSIDSLCRQMGVSRTQLHRLVKEQTDLSTTHFIRKIRLDKAYQLLTTTDLRIAEVGDRVGLDNPQNFSKYFTQQFGISPSGLRRKGPDAIPESFANPETIADTSPDPETPTPAGHASDILTVATPVLPAKQPLASRITSRRFWWAGLMLLAGLGGWLVYQFLAQPPAAAPSTANRNSVAVLPFRNMGPADTDYLVDGIMDDLHTELSLAAGLKVIARTSSDQYKDARKTVWQIGDELQVGHLLKGSVLKNGDRLQVKLELLRTRDDIRLWSKTYEGAYNDLFRITSRMNQEVLQQLSRPTNRATPRRHTTSLAAYNAMLQGRQLLTTRSEANIRASLVKLDEALTHDPDYADAYAYKASGYELLGNLGYTTDQAIYQQGLQYARQALQLDSTNSLAYGALGSLYGDLHQWQQADAAFRQALRYNPNDAQANYWYSLLLRALGRPAEAISYSTKALELDPLGPVIAAGHALNCAYAGRFDLADQCLDSNRLLFNDSFLYHFARGLCAMIKSDYRLGETAMQHAIQLNPQYTNHVPSLLYCEARQGKTDRARAYLADTPDTPARNLYLKAVVYAGLNDRANCLRSLKQAADEGYIYKDLLLFPPFRPYHRDPVFQDILRRYGLR